MAPTEHDIDDIEIEVDTPAVAPPATILDEAALRTIRDALQEGRQVTLRPDGGVEVSTDVVDAPMGAPAEAYIESQLGDVKALVEKGFEMHLHPAGQVFGASADGLTRIQGDLDVALGSDDLLTMKVVLGMGANVAVLPDGSVQTQHHLDQTPRSRQEVDDLLAELQRRVDDGSLAAEARAGRGLTIADVGDGSGTRLRFAQAAPDLPGIALPDDPAAPPTPAAAAADDIPEDPTGVDLAGLADRIDARSEAIRADALQDQVGEASRVGLERDAAARQAWMSQQGHEAAWQQARRELKLVQEATKQVQDLEARARAAEGTHSAAHVEDLRQQAAAHQARLDVARQRMESAQAEATRLGDEAAAHRDTVTATEARLAEIATRTADRLTFADLLEVQAGQVRAAGEAMAAGKEDEARAWLGDARVVGAGEAEPEDLVPDVVVPDAAVPDLAVPDLSGGAGADPSPGPITSPSQVEDGPITSPSQVEEGPITSPSQVDDVTGADTGLPPATVPATEAAEPQSAEDPAEDPAPQPAADPADAAADPAPAPDELELGLQAADSIEADLSFAGFDPEPAPLEDPEPEPEVADPAADDAAVLDG